VLLSHKNTLAYTFNLLRFHLKFEHDDRFIMILKSNTN